MEKSNFAIIAIMKDTPDYLLEAWINHHFKIGVDDIYILIDVGSKPLHQDERVHYIQITDDIKSTFDSDGYQKGAYKWMLKQIYTKYNWIACIDDDEFLQLNISVLEKYKNVEVLLLPWHFKGCDSIFPVTDLSKYFDVQNKKYYKFLNDDSFVKPMLNASLLTIKMIDGFNSVHQAFKHKSLFLHAMEHKPLFSPFGKIVRTKQSEMLEDEYIEHYMIRSFKEWVEQCFDRGDVIEGTLELSNFYCGRRFYDYFDYYNITDKFNPRDVYEMLKSIGRLDIYERECFEFKAPDDSEEKKFCAVAMVTKNPNVKVLDYVIQQNFKNGVDDIHIYYDKGNQVFYNNKDERIHYHYLGDNDKEILYLSAYSVPNENSRRQIGIFNYMYRDLRDKYEWILFLDDDECVDKHISFLNKYSDECSVYIAWENYISPSNDMDKQIKKQVYPYEAFFYKSAVNTSKTPMINTVHFGDMNGVTLDGKKITINDMFVGRYFASNIWDCIEKSKTDSVHIHHVLYTSFENLISKIFDRSSILESENKLQNMSFRIQMWYKLNDIQYSFDDLITRLLGIQREDIKDYVSNNSRFFTSSYEYKVNERLKLRCE